MGSRLPAGQNAQDDLERLPLQGFLPSRTALAKAACKDAGSFGVSCAPLRSHRVLLSQSSTVVSVTQWTRDPMDSVTDTICKIIFSLTMR